MASRIRPHVSYIRAKLGEMARFDQMHVGQPTGQILAQCTDASRITVYDDGEHTPGQVPRIVQPSSSRALARSASFPPVELGSGLPPSAQTNRSIISLSEDGAWYQLTGHTIIIPCAAAHIG